jgi:hypothetical protein
VRDCFDELSDSLVHLEHYVTSGLLIFEDVHFIFDYYVEKMNGHRNVFEEYMRAYRFERALRFIERYPSWHRQRT